MLAAQESPPATLRAAFKRWQKCSIHDIEKSDDIIDTDNFPSHQQLLPTLQTTQDKLRLNNAFLDFLPSTELISPKYNCYELKDFPGLFMYQSLLPFSIQTELLNKLLHRDLSNPEHNTNMHLHYDMTDTQDGRSVYNLNPTTEIQPLNSATHKTMTVQRMLEKKLRWVTLGGQYDWTIKAYPDEKPPPFPQDIAALLQGIFLDVDPQAAILNLYSPGDTLSVHQDVSEECDRGLVSISIGCDAVFLLGNTDGSKTATIRLRSGDAILMSGKARYAWHAVPRVIANTCPQELAYWPSEKEGGNYQHWKCWLEKKRINLNVRQMRATALN